MAKADIVHKQIDLTASERKQADESAKQGAGFYALPQPVFEFAARRLLVKMRKQSLTYKLPEVRVVHDIVKTEIKCDAGAGEFSVFVYKREGLTGT